ncbi:MAG TPA: lanthionine synthetase LanC family protein [Solirubrobacteraceae bacterium]
MADRDSMLATAERISQEILAAAVWKEDRCNWIGAMPEEGIGGRTTLSYRALGADLYGGTAGVGLFLAEIARTTADEQCRRTALGALRHAVSRVEDIPASQVGLYSGRPGVALALTLAARALDQPELDGAARAIASNLTGPGAGEELDLMSGSAGAIVGLLALRVLLEEEKLLDLAVLHGDALLAAAEQPGDGLCWPARMLPGTPSLTGLSHGAAGIAVALLELAAATGLDRYRLAAEAGFAYERTLFDPVARNWPDLRGEHRDGQASFAVFWCHGAPGGALARLRALELYELGELRGEAHAGLATTEDWVSAALASGSVNYSLCHGLAGNAEILLEGSTLSTTASDLAGRVAEAGIEDYLADERPWPSGAYGGFAPCLFLGLAGIGRFYLRLAQPELPSLLLVRPADLGGS